ncbi:PA0069 family radical SAM protein [Marilutibacter chinensis]|uniref:PA0069 family radical SAM protein n=1 Tax=Marilutibacter chinensis TaxID=2912247 RepID=A0ABS9I028_9GAMM|nr:PA0069 family radical SAM protein [Lysobacter chinensis]MCF7223657.1 PA0069 family radical SAM protein [Lysobacter chinensis]
MDDARKIVAPSPQRVKGRGAASYVDGRYAVTRTEAADDGWDSLADALTDRSDATSHPDTRVSEERARSVISRNDSPDIGFSQSVNPYRGCEHGCVYCFARPSHAYLDLSPGLDFETRLFAKTNTAERLRHELSKPGYRCTPIALGINTDAYQPIERRYRITRQCLELLAECRHPVSFVTKGATILRDLDLLAAMARQRLVTVYLSVTTLDNRLAARMEPRASAPHTRLKAIRELSAAGVPVGVLVAPVIPMINDGEIEAILEAAHAAGARAAGHVLLRLPHELKQVWREWLELHHPERAAHVMSLIRQMRGGKDYDSAFGTRMRGTGPFAELIAQRFRKAHRRFGYGRLPALDCSRFVPPRRPSPQGELF